MLCNQAKACDLWRSTGQLPAPSHRTKLHFMATDKKLTPIGYVGTRLPIETKCSWVQQPRETDLAYQMFRTYLGFDEHRSVEKAKKMWVSQHPDEIDSPEYAYLMPHFGPAWERVAETHLWERRAKDFDRELVQGHGRIAALTTTECVAEFARALKRGLLSSAADPRNATEAGDMLQLLLSVVPKESLVELMAKPVPVMEVECPQIEHTPKFDGGDGI
jgi:hypothetical protein